MKNNCLKLNKQIINIIILIILIIVLLLSFLIIKNLFKNETTILDEVKIQNNSSKNNGIALMLQKNDGTYEESTSSSWPSNMKFNSELSGCMDANGKKIDNSLNYNKNTNSIKLKVNGATYCYVYFDIREILSDYLIKNVSSEELWNSTLEDDGYRYVGTNPDNYICFGTTDKTTCTSDTDKYMYRIIGIFEDNDGNKHVKLIKKEALNTAYAWNSNYSTDVDWNNSDLYKGLNGSYFLTNTSYPYMQDSTWTSKISNWNYTMANTKSYKNYTENSVYGPFYTYISSKALYLHELNRSSKSSETCYFNNTTSANCNVGKWDILNTKISLMYASDYMLSLGSSSLNYTSNSNASTIKTGWMQLSKNDSSAPSNNEWTMTRYDYNGWSYGGWYLYFNGGVFWNRTDDATSIRPVFYLESKVEYDEGTGKINDPIMITMEEDNSAASTLISTISSDVLWNSPLEDDGYRYVGTNPNNYICFGTSDKTTCTNDADTYMFRIIGVFEDSENNKHLKLIKNSKLKTLQSNSTTQFNNTFVWNSMTNQNVDWNNSDLYNGLNGDYFWSSSIYTYTYMTDPNETWRSKISTWKYTMANTKQYESNGVNYRYNTGKTVYLHELNKNDKLNQTCYYTSSSTVNCNIGEWKSVNTKIGLMYVSDYLLSLGNTALSYTSSSDYNNFKTSWLQLSDNNEWTMTRIGKSGTYYWSLYSSIYGGINEYNVGTNCAIRPVFYLNSNVKFASNTGNGTINNPYIIS